MISTNHPEHYDFLAWSLLLLGISACYLPFTAAAQHVGFTADDALYLMMADWFRSSWHDDPVLLYVQSVSHLPPLYSLVLALAGAGSAQIDVAHLVQTLFLIGAVTVHGCLAGALTGRPRRGMLVMLILAVLPATVILATEIWSEFLYLLLIGTALLLALRAPRHGAWWLASALLVGLAAVTRGFGVVAIVAIVLVTALRARRWLAPVIVLSVAPLVACDRLGYGGARDYVDIFTSRVAGFASLFDYLLSNLHAILDGWLELFAPVPPTWVAALSLALAPATLLVLGRRLARVEFDALYACGYLALLAIWPFPNVMDRLIYPLVPLAIIYAIVGSGHIGARFADRRLSIPLTYLPLLGLLALVGAGGGTLIWRYLAHTPPPELSAWRASRYWITAADPAAAQADISMRAAILKLLAAVPGHVPIQSCIYTMHPQAVMFYTRRIAWPPRSDIDLRRPPQCHYHVLFGSSETRAQAQLLWPHAQVLESAAGEKGIAALLAGYPR